LTRTKGNRKVRQVASWQHGPRTLLMWRFSEQISLLPSHSPNKPARLHFPLLPEFLSFVLCKKPRRTTANLHLLRHNLPSVDCKGPFAIDSLISGDIQANLQNVPERPQTIDPCRRLDEPVRRCRSLPAPVPTTEPNTSIPSETARK
jgi:hypothetical protein